MSINNKEATVLIVEDETDLREAIVTALTYEEFNVLAAENGEMGLAIARTQKPNIILLDLMMPKMDGLTMLKHLRSDDRGKDVKVIVMTAVDDLERIAEVVEAGGDEYVVKTSITLNGIIAKIKENLQHQKN